MTGIISTLAEMVPQISYDIIARFVPGSIVMFSWAVVTRDDMTQAEISKLLDDLNKAGGWSVPLFLSIAYIVSIVLYGVWMLIVDRGKKESAPNPLKALIYDAIRVKSPAVGARIVKLRAEARLAQVLIVGWAITFILNLLPLIRDRSMQRGLLAVALPVGIAGAYKVRQRVKGKYVINLKNHWYILRLYEEPWLPRPSSDQNYWLDMSLLSPSESWLDQLGDKLGKAENCTEPIQPSESQLVRFLNRLWELVSSTR